MEAEAWHRGFFGVQTRRRRLTTQTRDRLAIPAV